MNRSALAVIVAVAVVIIAVYTCLDPTQYNFFPRCPSKLITGYDCPGCGSQRALHALFNGDFVSAARYNLMIFPAGLMVVLLTVCELGRHRYQALERLYLRLNAPAVIWTVFILFVVWTAVRNIFLPL